ncbi:hypothetical protein Clacol_004069 [Clathrus columnatus]|uniref:RecA family profile 1 domain-containing protein n=1 Tax=Clathrus columnatus TaxID=1419009 RepID=A0AAV5AAA6_9AGAM|nr:hypothetical protein Clacol_004069 [Clathrus columnatus]
MTSTPSIQTVHDLSTDFQGFITTGDKYFDEALGGGILPGTITELVGSSSTGKTQLALQLSLTVQLPRSQGGLGGSTCYITTKIALHTQRLLEIQANHPLLSTLSPNETLDRIKTVATDNFPKLLRALKEDIHIAKRTLDESGFPLRLLIIDSVNFVFNTETKTTAKSLIERSKEVTELALILHRLASENIAILVINDVNSVFNSNKTSVNKPSDTVIYIDQARWFGRGDGASADGPVEAGMGLVWANQIGTRIMLTRTGRRRYVPKFRESKRQIVAFDDDNVASSSPRPDDTNSEGTTIALRQLSVVFSQFSAPSTLDYIITSAGVVSQNAHET